MARIVLTNASITFASTDISSYVSSITLSSSLDVVDTTSFGNTARTRVAGLADNQVTIEFFQDFASGALESVVYPTIGTSAAMVVKPVAGSTTATNPSYSFNALVSEWQPLSGAVGELSTASVTWPVSGAITKATS
ncbi:MAG: hypothetical protein KGR70_13450 [Cyanobacteria bacterium REEB494]|nr:hypothetical protein [Cyanobacteria bacterium REEB494]